MLEILRGVIGVVAVVGVLVGVAGYFLCRREDSGE
jgi:hypothetical protein